ncbi:MAG: tetratricopeptide repeat-containing sulfotransferase family protein [Pseudomonadales bacterium]
MTEASHSGAGERLLAEARRRVLEHPADVTGWLELARHLIAMGEITAARDANAEALLLWAQSAPAPLRRAAVALRRGRLPEAQLFAEDMLRTYAGDALAQRIAAEIAFRRNEDAVTEAHLEQVLAREPEFPGAQFALALVQYRRGDLVAARASNESLLSSHPSDPAARTLLASVLTRLNELESAADCYRRLGAEYPGNASLWTLFGHVLKSQGQQAEAIAAYRRSISIKPGHGETWWSLANLKTVRFAAADADAMEHALNDSAASDEDRVHFHFALGKAYEDLGRYAESFAHYDRGNTLRLSQIDYASDSSTINLRRSQQVFTRDFFARRAGLGCEAQDPIFIVGLPRSGSTLLEQILASHPLVEGTMELSEVSEIARGIADQRTAGDDYDYLPALEQLGDTEWRRLGERYIELTRVHRKTDRPYFIDKMPNNFAHLGLIHLMLPNARIIDARRHPLATCFSNFKQHFAMGQFFSYGFENIGTFYRDYVALMAHIDAVLPGRVHRVIYERLVEDTETEVRRLLDYCGLPFDRACLSFYDNPRVVRTASSEQVRRPIYREGVDHWRHYEPWLGPLREILGPVLDVYPAVPALAEAFAQSPKR